MSKKSSALLILSFSLAIWVFLKNAWVTEDAYIIFRSLEQLFAGNGPVWNPHERGQVFTSPLWYFTLALVRTISSNVYLNAIYTSLFLWIATILVTNSIFTDKSILFLSVLMMISSNGFFDYTSSGLENSLAYFIISLYLYFYIKLNESHINTPQRKSNIKHVMVLFGLLLCVRHDLALLFALSSIYVIAINSDEFTPKELAISVIIVFLPFTLYTLFSLIYYGFPFPNTAYAKLNTDIDKIQLIHQGIKYFYSSIKYDLITLLIIIGSLGANILSNEKKYLNYLGYGIILNLCYVVYVGGDFMQGRFFSYAYLVAIIIIITRIDQLRRKTAKIMAYIAVCTYLAFYPHTPFNSPVLYNNNMTEMGISDERGVFFKHLSLYSYINRDPNIPIFPDHPWAINGYIFKNLPDKLVHIGNIGLVGYHAGIDKIIIDTNALSDPLLARMPVSGKWRIGHFERNIPEGYFESVKSGTENITDQSVNEYYKKIKIITQGNKLFTLERLKTILLINIGAYHP